MAWASSISAQGITDVAAVGQRVDHHRRGAEHVHHHRDPALEAPRRDQARQQVHEHSGTVGRALFRGSRHAMFPFLLGTTIMCIRTPIWGGIVLHPSRGHANRGPIGPTNRTEPPPRQGPGYNRDVRLPAPGDFRYPSTLQSRRPRGRATRAKRPGQWVPGTTRPDPSRCMDARAERARSCRWPGRGDSSATWCTSRTGCRRRRSAGRWI